MNAERGLTPGKTFCRRFGLAFFVLFALTLFGAVALGIWLILILRDYVKGQ